ncbi:FKBP-type peptidyl-prolyl cis-trans isomerase [Mariniblastus fucicola]|uniref:peptidylprolyl isomerase n=1 Tax=Mariniblastus fucicola TaxID=980251 RepID=A0A5B9PP71_9BACT|nr:FKBP-type peptidyl-prolyl cis-trans isomerase [Mariniblastus fucicola]QEG24053.1 FKBP-type 22 kDa peptidyl-prolyl cis-trans isomerase [Mariniblastus fucicola]
MARSRNNRTKLAYGALENRCLLANSVFFLNTGTSTLHIQAGETDVVDATYTNEMTISIDTETNELVVTEPDAAEQRFDSADITRISYRGTPGDDFFSNETDISTRVVGYAGNDMIFSGGGDDVVIAANGDDTVYPGNGNDYVAGGQGNDHVIETDESTGNDRLFGGPGDDILEGGMGADFVAGHEGNDMLYGGSENDSILGHDGLDQMFGGSGRDFMYGGDGNDEMFGEYGRDRILGQAGNDTISGGFGDDVALGGDGNDTIDGDEGNDRLVGNLGNDILRGGVGADSLIAATPSPDGNTSGFDTVEAGDDTDIDYAIIHPGSDTATMGEEDNVADSEIIRRNLQVRFLDQNLGNGGWQETASGLQYRTVILGTGDTPVATDTVRVNYEGSFIDGTLFDANDGITFQLNQVISGWTEGLQLIQVGATIELAIPAELAYGENYYAGIPGGSTLLFTVDLIEIVS